MSFADSKVLTTNFSRKSETGTVLILACGAIAIAPQASINTVPVSDLRLKFVVNTFESANDIRKLYRCFCSNSMHLIDCVYVRQTL